MKLKVPTRYGTNSESVYLETTVLFLTHQRLRLFLFLIFIIFLNIAPIILQRRDKEKNNFYFHRKCVFLG